MSSPLPTGKNKKGDISQEVMYKAIDITNKILSACLAGTHTQSGPSGTNNIIKKNIATFANSLGKTERNYTHSNLSQTGSINNVIELLYNSTDYYLKNSQKVYNNIISFILNKSLIYNNDVTIIEKIIDKLILYYTDKNKDVTKEFILYTFMTIYNKLEFMTESREKNAIINKLKGPEDSIKELGELAKYYNNTLKTNDLLKSVIRPDDRIVFYLGNKWVDGIVKCKASNNKITVTYTDSHGSENYFTIPIDHITKPAEGETAKDYSHLTPEVRKLFRKAGSFFWKYPKLQYIGDDCDQSGTKQLQTGTLHPQRSAQQPQSGTLKSQGNSQQLQSGTQKPQRSAQQLNDSILKDILSYYPETNNTSASSKGLSTQKNRKTSPPPRSRSNLINQILRKNSTQKKENLEQLNDSMLERILSYYPETNNTSASSKGLSTQKNRKTSPPPKK